MKETKKPINLLRGWPAFSLLPAAALRAAAQRALSDPAIFEPGLEYGPDPGYQPLREALAHWLSAFYSPSPSSSSGDGAIRGNASIWETGNYSYSHPPDPDRITITGGASQSAACVLQSFTDPARTRAVWMVAPCYFLACPIFADAGFVSTGGGSDSSSGVSGSNKRLRAVPEDDEGIDLEFLERGLRAVDAEWEEAEAGRRGGGYKDPGPYRKIYRHVIYCVPSFANPSGKTMSLARREGLVRLAREFDALVICDDVYDHLQWPSLDTATATATDATSSSHPLSGRKALLPRLIDIDLALGASRHDPPSSPPSSTPPAFFGHVVSNGSFSKLSGPGVRTGWTESSAAFARGLSQTGSTRSGGAPSQLTATIVAELLRAGDLDAHIDRVLKPAYQRRHALLVAAVERCLVAPPAVRARVRGRRSLVAASGGGEDGDGEDIYGGFFVWVSFGGGGGGGGVPPARVIAERCLAEENLVIGHGDLFEVHGDGDDEATQFAHDVRLCFAWEDEADLVEGVERLARVIGRMIEEGDAGLGEDAAWRRKAEDGGIDQMK
ncbi:Valine--pyruvate aminotransferase [Diatrype stigma]|uniref:Valine--pyruvate aminotransferase n=1 Tax=Diatrype stigma TaxID=117547 RepID=A0AAN9YRI6_9PEZI